MSDRRVAWTRAQLDATEAAAKAATPGPWTVDDETHAETIYGADDVAVVAGGKWGGEASVFDSTEDAIHIALHDPAAVLADSAARASGSATTARGADCGTSAATNTSGRTPKLTSRPDPGQRRTARPLPEQEDGPFAIQP